MKRLMRLILIAVMLAAGHGAVQLNAAVSATGGDETLIPGYMTHTFKAAGSNIFSVTEGGTVEVLLVGGGGGGGQRVGGGGGGGGVVYATNYMLTAGTKTIVIGAGGAGATANDVLGSNGQDSIFDCDGGAGKTITALGGGGGSSYNKTPGTGGTGGSGGGGSYYSSGSRVGPGGAAAQTDSGVTGASGYGFPGGAS